MPIKDKSVYPAEWKAISRRIRHERANNKCEQCGAPNQKMIIRSQAYPAKFVVLDDEGDCFWALDGTHESHLPDAIDYADGKMVKVVLTVAHMDHDPSNNDEANLRALCQRCHLVHDAQQHAENARKTRALKKAEALREAGQEMLL